MTVENIPPSFLTISDDFFILGSWKRNLAIRRTFLYNGADKIEREGKGMLYLTSLKAASSFFTLLLSDRLLVPVFFLPVCETMKREEK